MEKLVITIGRQLGSDGRKIGRILAEKLGIPFYDKELIVEAAKESGLSEKMFENSDEKPTNSFLYSLVMSMQPGTGLYNHYSDFLNNDHIFKIQSDVIKKIADKDSCIVVGRCADYVLRETEGVIKIFIYADVETRTKRIAIRDGVDEKKAKTAVLKADKKRGNYYNFYTNQEWGNAKNYDLSIDSAKLSAEDIVNLLESYVNLRKKS